MKRVLSMALALVMLFTLLPVSAFADDTDNSINSLLFEDPATHYNNEMASLTAWLCQLSYWNDTDIVKWYRDNEFSDEIIFNYSSYFEVGVLDSFLDKIWKPSAFKGIVAYKKIDIDNVPTTIVTITAKGTDPSNIYELFSDLHKSGTTQFLGADAYNEAFCFMQVLNAGLADLINQNRDDLMTPENLKVIVTGHSLGGAGANLLGAMITYGGIWNGILDQDDIYVYTYGAIKSIAENKLIYCGYENIHNIYNYWDTFSSSGYMSVLGASSYSYKFGHADIFNNEQFHFDEFGFSTNNHDISTYRDAVSDGVVHCINNEGSLDPGIELEADDTGFPDFSMLTDTISWSINNNSGVLYICGTGEMPNFDKDIAPWRKESYLANVKTVIIGNGITNVGNWAFLRCGNLLSVILPNSITKIGEGAFELCTSLSNITIPSSVKNIESDAFFGCSKLSSITIPDSVTSIGSWAFYDCSRLSNVILSKNLKNIEINMFKNCSSLVSITIPGSVSGIGFSAFYGCSSLKDVTLEKGISSIAANAFFACSSLSNITLPYGITEIGAYSFKDCINLISITIPNSVESIGDYTFYGCTSLSGAIIPDSVATIGDYAFCECCALTSITLPNAIKGIGEYLFKGCNSLTSIRIPNSIETIGNYAFLECSSLINIEIPEDVNYIGSYAFSKCSNLKNATFIGNAPTEFGEYVFSFCADDFKIKAPLSDTWTDDAYNKKLQTWNGYPIEFYNTHTHNYKAVITDPTCTEQGYTKHICSDCGESYKDNYVDALGHKTELINSKAATCTKAGYTGDKVCTVCGKTVEKGKTIAKLGHSYTKKVVKPTASKQGYTQYTCSVCGYSYKTSYTIAAPTVKLSTVASTGKIKLTWGKIAGADKYYIYRSTDSGKTYKFYASTTNTSYTNTGTTAGKTYYYKVKAVKIRDDKKTYSAYSTVHYLTCDLARPTVKITTSKGDPKLTWAKITGATKYEVYRATSKSGTYSKMITTSKTSYTNTSAKAGKTYYYKVKAVCGTSAAASAYSTVVSIKAK